METKKLIIFGLIFFLILLVVYLLLLIPSGRVIPDSEPAATPVPGLRQPTLTFVPPNKKIKIGEVEVNNFYAIARFVSEDDNVNIVSNDRYQISYIGRGNYFQISLTGSPFDKVREEAENEFVKILGISKEEACLLPVNLTTPQYANPEYAGEIFPLSFCPG